MPRPPKTLIASIFVLISRESQPEILAAANSTIANVSSKSTALLGGTTALAGVLASPHFWSIAIGAVGVFGGMWITWVFKQRELRIKLEYAERRDRREQELHDTQMMRQHEEEDLPMFIVYTSPNCPQCRITKRTLAQAGIPFEERDATTAENLAYIRDQLGYTQAPVVVVGSESWCGYRPDKIKEYAHAND